MSKFLYIKINGRLIKVLNTFTILQACKFLGINIPCFCYHESLFIAGNCRMCLVEGNINNKLIVSCTSLVSKNLQIYTNSSRVKKVRESILEFLLINHPLDCPICDQGGECDLQDFTYIFGVDRGRFYKNFKKTSEDEFFNPLIKTIMTRCIQCTRCVRFSIDIIGLEDFGVIGRGFNMEIGNYVTKMFNNELSGNIIDLCPVGALTSEPFSFINRSWDLQVKYSLDILDNLGGNIRLDIYNNKIVRVLPTYDYQLNEEWISNKTRFSYDALNIQRLQKPLFRFKELVNLNFNQNLNNLFQNNRYLNWFFLNKKKLNLFDYLDYLILNKFDFRFLYDLNGKEYIFFNFYEFFFFKRNYNIININFLSFNWNFLFRFITCIWDIRNRFKFMEVYLGQLVDTETSLAIKDFFNILGNSNVHFETYLKQNENFDFRYNYLFNNNLVELKNADYIFLLSTNPRLEAPLLNIKIRKQTLNNFNVFSIGNSLNYMGYFSINLGNKLNIFLNIIQGKHKNSQLLFLKKKPFFFFGINLFFLLNNQLFSNYVERIYKYLNYEKLYNNYSTIFHNLNTYTGRISAIDLGCINLIKSTVNFSLSYYNIMDDFYFDSIKYFNNINETSNFYYLLGSDDFDFYYNLNLENKYIISKFNLKNNNKFELDKQSFNGNISYGSWIIYQGHHWDHGASIADIILPGVTYLEKKASFSNLLGNYKTSSNVITYFNNWILDWSIIKMHWIYYYYLNVSDLSVFSDFNWYFINFFSNKEFNNILDYLPLNWGENLLFDLKNSYLKKNKIKIINSIDIPIEDTIYKINILKKKKPNYISFIFNKFKNKIGFYNINFLIKFYLKDLDNLIIILFFLNNLGIFDFDKQLILDFNIKLEQKKNMNSTILIWNYLNKLKYYTRYVYNFRFWSLVWFKNISPYTTDIFFDYKNTESYNYLNTGLINYNLKLILPLYKYSNKFLRFILINFFIKGKFNHTFIISNLIDNFYSTDSITRCSKIMNKSFKFFNYNKPFEKKIV